MDEKMFDNAQRQIRQRVCACVCACVSTGQQLMLTGTTPAAVTPQAPYPGYGYTAPGFPPQPAYGFNM